MFRLFDRQPGLFSGLHHPLHSTLQCTDGIGRFPGFRVQGISLSGAKPGPRVIALQCITTTLASPHASSSLRLETDPASIHSRRFWALSPFLGSSPFPSLIDEFVRTKGAASGVHGHNTKNNVAASDTMETHTPPASDKAQSTDKGQARDDQQVQPGPLWTTWRQETRTMRDGAEQATTTITRTKDSSGRDDVVEERQLGGKRQVVKGGQGDKAAEDNNAEFDQAWRTSKAAQRLENRREQSARLDPASEESSPATTKQASPPHEEEKPPATMADAQPTHTAQPAPAAQPAEEGVGVTSNAAEQEASNSDDAAQGPTPAVVDDQKVASLVGLGFPDTELASLALRTCDGDVAKSTVALLKLRRLDVPKERVGEALSLLHSNDDLNAVAAELGVNMIALSH